MVNKRAIIIKSGVIIKIEKVLPRPRMIFVERFTTPLARVFGLSQLFLRATRTNLITAELTNDQINSILGVISEGDEKQTF